LQSNNVLVYRCFIAAFGLSKNTRQRKITSAFYIFSNYLANFSLKVKFYILTLARRNFFVKCHPLSMSAYETFALDPRLRAHVTLSWFRAWDQVDFFCFWLPIT